MADFYELEESSGLYELEDGTGFLELEDSNLPIAVPFIPATTALFAPVVANDAFARITQEPVEVVVSPTSGKVRVTQEPVEIVIAPDDAEVRLTQIPVEVIYRNTHEHVFVMVID